MLEEKIKNLLSDDCKEEILQLSFTQNLLVGEHQRKLSYFFILSVLVITIYFIYSQPTEAIYYYLMIFLYIGFAWAFSTSYLFFQKVITIDFNNSIIHINLPNKKNSMFYKFFNAFYSYSENSIKFEDIGSVTIESFANHLYFTWYFHTRVILQLKEGGNIAIFSLSSKKYAKNIVSFIEQNIIK